MIYIQEDKPFKIPGLTSLHIPFTLNKELNKKIWNVLLSCECVNQSKTMKEWEVPLTDLAHILDGLSKLDDIILTLLKETDIVEKATQLKPILNYKVMPYKYQLDGIEYGLNHDKWLLLDDMGLGKTLQMILLAEELKAQKHIEHCLIICGINSLKNNWQKEINKFSNEKSVIIGQRVNKKGNIVSQSISERIKQLNTKIEEFFVIINVESIRNEQVLNAIIKGVNKFDMVVVDEMHKCCGVDAIQSKNLLKLKSPYKIGLTGTLILNSCLDAYVPLTWIEKSTSTLTNFKNYFCVFDAFNNYQIIGAKNMNILQDIIDSCSLRRKKDLVDLPPKTIIDEYIDMNDAHANFYKDIKNGVKEEADKIDLDINNMLALTTRLRQASTCPSMITTLNIENSKLNRCKELVDDFIAQNEKVVILSNFKEPVYKLKEILEEYNPVIATGDLSDTQISESIDKFQNDDKYKVFIGTISKAGTGITLTKACYMIMLDLPWTKALYNQATDRIYRIGQKSPVFIYNLICNNTIDEMVLKLITRKGAIGDYLVDNNISKENVEILKAYIKDM